LGQHWRMVVKQRWAIVVPTRKTVMVLRWLPTMAQQYKKLISRWDGRTLPPEPRHRCKTLPPLYAISPNVPILSSNRDFFGASWRFWL